jgi:lysophospholipase L1-like esterase
MLKSKKLKALITTSLVTVFILSMTGTAFAKEVPSVTAVDYVSLGDSLAEGQTPHAGSDYYRVHKSYTDYIANKLDKEGILGSYNNFGVSGYTTSDVYNDVIKDIYNPDSKIKSAEIITLDAGANDLLGYLKTNNIPAISVEAPKVIERIGSIIAAIKAVNPTAKIYVMGYYNALPAYPQVLPLIEQFNTGLENGINGYNYLNTLSSNTYVPVTYVDTMSAVSVDYLPGDIHPNYKGYKNIGDAFLLEILNDFR